MIKNVLKWSLAAALSAACLSSFAGFSYFQQRSDAPVFSINFFMPAGTHYVDLKVNGNDFGVESLSGGGKTMATTMVTDNEDIKSAIESGRLKLNLPNTFLFYECTNQSCTTKKLMQQSAGTVTITQSNPGVAIYTANPNVLSVTSK